MPLTIIHSNITKLKVDAIVNVTNTKLQKRGGVCGAIFRAAGEVRLQKACEALVPIQTGEAVITDGFALPSKYIIHTVGPVYHNGSNNMETLLRSCYINSLDLAQRYGCDNIAFPLISSGVFGYPKDKTLTVATKAIGDWLMINDMDVSLVISGRTSFAPSKKLLGEIREFIDRNYSSEFSEPNVQASYNKNFSERKGRHLEKRARSTRKYSHMHPVEPFPTFGELVSNLDEHFSETLLRLIDAKGMTDVEVYKRANIDRKLFSKIRTGKGGYMPSKKTVVALAVALELSLPETRNLLERAGFALSRSVVFDVIIEYFITQKKYDIFEINNVLFEYDQPLLGE